MLQLEDGSQAFEIKDYLVSLDTCESVSFENLEFPGKGKGRTKLELSCVLRLLKPCASNGKVWKILRTFFTKMDIWIASFANEVRDLYAKKGRKIT